jgi:hypothetical protein
MDVIAPMDAESSRWNDDRLDEFATNVDKRFDRIEDRMDMRFDRLDQELARTNGRLDDLIKVLIAGVIAFAGAVLTGFAGILALIATQL